MTEQTFPVTGPLDLVVRLGHGSVHVAARADLTEARVRLESPNTELLGQTTVDLSGSTLTITGPRQGGVFDLFPGLSGLSSWSGGGEKQRNRLDVRVEVPSGSRTEIHAGSAPITAEGRLGACDLAFAAGDVTLGEIDGDLRLRYGSGTVSAGTIHGQVVVRSGAGDVTLDEVDGDLRAGTGSGTLRVGVVRGRVGAKTGAGAAHLGAVHGDVSVVSGSGPLSIGLPAGISARLDVATGSGTVSSDLPVEDAPGAGRPISVRARTGSGDVRLFRAA